MSSPTGVMGRKEETAMQLNQLFARIAQEAQMCQPDNPVHFFADFLCRNYPEHLHGFGDLWNDDPQCEFEKELVLDFFRYNKISSDVASVFLDQGYDTLESVMSLTPEDIASEEAFQHFLPGHKVRLRQLFETITDRVKSFRKEREAFFRVRSFEQMQMEVVAPEIVSKALTSPPRIVTVPSAASPHHTDGHFQQYQPEQPSASANSTQKNVAPIYAQHDRQQSSQPRGSLPPNGYMQSGGSVEHADVDTPYFNQVMGSR